MAGGLFLEQTGYLPGRYRDAVNFVDYFSSNGPGSLYEKVQTIGITRLVKNAGVGRVGNAPVFILLALGRTIPVRKKRDPSFFAFFFF